jgi:Holliday junction resolvase
MPSEKAIVEAIKRLLKKRGAWVVKFHGGGQGPYKTRVGVPDLLCCYRGRFLAIEVKQPGKKPSPIQEHEIGKILDAGGIAIVADGVPDVEATLNEVDALVG